MKTPIPKSVPNDLFGERVLTLVSGSSQHRYISIDLHCLSGLVVYLLLCFLLQVIYLLD